MKAFPFVQVLAPLRSYLRNCTELSMPLERNIVPFFDNSAGTGKAPDAVPEIPSEYLRDGGQAMNFVTLLHKRCGHVLKP